VDEAWARLTPEAERATAEVNRLQQLAAGLGQDATAPLAAVRAQLEAVRAQIARDPLGAAGVLAHEVAGRLSQLGDQLTALQTRQHQTLADLDRAHALLRDLRATHQRATDTHRRCSTEIQAAPTDPPRPLPVDGGRVEGLAQWLQTLDATMAEGRWPSAGVGVTRWLAAAQEVLADEETVERTSSAPLDRRDELLGRLAARRQQARTLVARGRPADPDLEPLARQADDLLHRVPVPLTDAAEVIAAYEARLHAAG